MRFFQLSSIYFIMQTNSFLHFLRRFQLLRGMITNKLVKSYKLKSIIGIVAIIIDFVKKTIGKGLSILMLAYFIPTWLFDFFEKPLYQSDLIICFLIINSVIPALVQSLLFRVEAEDNMYLNHFMVDPAPYYKYKITKHLIMNSIFIVPVLLYIFQWDWLLVITLFAVKLFVSIWGNCLYVFYYDKKSRVPKAKLRALIGSIVGAAVYLILIFTDIELKVLHINVVIGLDALFILLAIIGYIRLMRYPKYLRIARQYANKDTVRLRIAVSDVTPEEHYVMDKTEWKNNKLYVEENKDLNGIDYINKTFLKRHSRIINWFYRGKALFLLFGGIAAGLLMRYKEMKLDVNSILSYSPLLITLIMFLAFGRQYCLMYFYRCDSYLLENNLYNSSDLIYKGFRFRLSFLLKKTIGTSIMICIGLAAAFIISSSQIDLLSFATLAVTSISLLYFYELYYVIVYYLVQPYTSEAGIKSPIYLVLNYVQMLIGLGFLFIREDITFLCIPLVIVTILFGLTGMYLVKRFGKRTFYLK